MEKPGSGPAKPQQLIIDTPEVLRRRDRWAEVGITLFFWVLLLYLWQPLLSFLAWFVQGYVLYEQMVTLGGYQSFVDSALNYLLAILLFDGVFLLWARVNQWRFRGNEKRRAVPDTSLLQQCLFFNVDATAVTEWRQHRQLVVHFDEAGGIVAVDPGGRPAV